MNHRPRPSPRVVLDSWLSAVLKYRRALIVAVQLVVVALSNHVAFQLRFDADVPAWALVTHLQTLPWLVLIRALMFAPFGLYEGLWRYASVWDLRNIVLSVGASSAIFYAFVKSPFGVQAYPRSVYIIDGLLLVCLLGGIRLASRMYRELSRVGVGRGVLVYGAGDAGEMVVRDMRQHPAQGYDPMGFIDDNPSKVGSRIHGVPVLGTSADLAAIVRSRHPEEVLIAIPSAKPEHIRRVLHILEPFKVTIKTLPNLRDIIDGRVELSQIRTLVIEDLLDRKRIDLDERPLREFVEGRRVLVTGAGGSIGAELCRQIARYRPALLILYERYENGLHAIAMRLVDQGHGGCTRAVLGDITDQSRLDAVMREYQPEIVFHAAAHKHVPMMEDNACEAVKNNVIGTRLVAQAAERHGVDRFILISTDKAVNPTSVMGATKRVAELFLQVLAPGSGTSFCTVRFGNVLASSGSVVPRFLDQIKAGGPVTVTHPEMKRYFMLIPEAVELVLHTAARGKSGQVYVLRMGEQVSLVDLARNLIRLSGFTPDEDIPITFTGIRPGEKLYEELVGPQETVEPFEAQEIMHVQPLSLPEAAVLTQQIAELERRARGEDRQGVLAQLSVITAEFRTADAPRAETAEPRVIPQEDAVPPAGVEPGRCRRCQSTNLHRSRPRSWAERLVRQWTHRRPYRCHDCGWRGWLVPSSDIHPVQGLTDPRGAVDLASLDSAVKAETKSSRPAFSPRDLG